MLVLAVYIFLAIEDTTRVSMNVVFIYFFLLIFIFKLILVYINFEQIVPFSHKGYNFKCHDSVDEDPNSITYTCKYYQCTDA